MTIALSLLITLYKRSLAGVIFILPLAIHYAVTENIDGDTYYITSALVSGLTAGMLSCMRATKTTLLLAVLSFLCVGLDYLGYNLWYSYSESFIYQAGFALIYLSSCIIIGRDNGRLLELPGRIGRLYLHWSLCTQSDTAHQKQKGT